MHKHLVEHSHESRDTIQVASQRLLAQPVRVQKALSFLGSSLPPEDIKTSQAFQLKAPGTDVNQRIIKLPGTIGVMTISDVVLVIILTIGNVSILSPAL